MLSIVLPCYNESDNLPDLLAKLDRLELAETALEIVLVNNGSTDRSAEVFNHLLSSRDKQRYQLVDIEINRGYGFGILSGLNAARGEILGISHADHQTDPQDLLTAYKIFTEKGKRFSMVKGVRKNRKWLEALFSYFMALVSSMALGMRLREINAQPKVFSRRFYEQVKEKAPYDFSLDLYLLYKAKKSGEIAEFPVFFNKRMAGEAKGGSGSTWQVKWKLIKRSFKYIFELRKSLKNRTTHGSLD